MSWFHSSVSILYFYILNELYHWYYSLRDDGISLDEFWRLSIGTQYVQFAWIDMYWDKEIVFLSSFILLCSLIVSCVFTHMAHNRSTCGPIQFKFRGALAIRFLKELSLKACWHKTSLWFNFQQLWIHLVYCKFLLLFSLLDICTWFNVKFSE